MTALARTQALLARLFVDARLRRAFFDAPVAVAQDFGLSEAEARCFARIDRQEVEAFARSLLGKRVLDLRKAMPLTAQALGEKFDATVLETSMITTRHREDARALGEHVAQMARQGACPAYVVDVARFELAFIEAARAGVWIRRFAHDVAPIALALRAGAPVSVQERVVIGVWWRLPGAGLRWRLVAAPRFQARR